MKKYILLALGTIILIWAGNFAYGQYIKYYVPKGDLRIIIINSDGQPVKKVEVDVSEKPGQPQRRDETDKNGEVLFESLPVGDYSIYFNLSNFPANLEFPHNIYQATVKQNQVKEKQIELSPKK